MGNVLRVLKRDIVRLLKAPSALVVVLALLVLPSVYTWYNVIGFWNPYDNTGNLRVCVVNEDEGASSELTGEMHVGDMIVDELHENTQLDWVFADYDSAMSELDSGVSYAVFVIPRDFTENMLSLTTGSFTQPALRYYVNEKAGPVAPKITDTGATTLDETINSTFVSTVSDVAVEAVDKAIDESSEAFDASRAKAAFKVGMAVQVIGDARASLADIVQANDQAQGKVSQAKLALEQARTSLVGASAVLGDVSRETDQVRSDLTNFSSAVLPMVDQGLANVSSVSAKANAAAGSLAAASTEAQGNISATIAQGNIAVSESRALASQVRSFAEALPDSDPRKEALLSTATELDRRADQAQAALSGLTEVNNGAADMTASVTAAADALDDAVQGAVSSAQGYSDALFGTTLPAVNDSLAQLSTASASLSTALSNQQVLIDQASLVLDQLSSTLVSAREALAQTDSLLSGLQDELDTVRTDVLALSESDALVELFGEDGLDAAKIASFMGSPTEVVTEQLYSLNAYGSAMAPLFMNLTFWIGAFMLLVILKQEVDNEGVPKLTLAQRYVARFSLFAVFAVIQALVCCVGVLLIGVEAANVGALFFAAALASLAYLSIIYALSVTLQHIGKGICVVLVFAQIPGATGLYPIEMTSSFFQTLYPFFPFTYGIGAMREAICGFYGGQYAHDVGVLLAFFVVFMALGILLRPLMSNVNRMVAGQVRESDLFNGEDVETPLRPYKFSQIVRALSDQKVYRTELQARYERFSHWYPRLIRGSIVVGVGVPIVLVVVFALTPAEKVTLLTVWLVWLVAVFVFLVVVESLRYSFERQMKLGTMSEAGLHALYATRDSMTHTAVASSASTTCEADAIRGSGASDSSVGAVVSGADVGAVAFGAATSEAIAPDAQSAAADPDEKMRVHAPAEEDAHAKGGEGRA